MKNYFKKIAILFCLVALLILPDIVSASQSLDNLKTVGEGGTGADNAPWAKSSDTNSMAGIVGIVIKAFLGLLGVIFLVLVIYAGYSWMTAQGDEDKVTKAIVTLQRAVIGLIVTVGAYAISLWVVDKLITGRGILK